MNALAALAFTLAGIHVGSQRVIPVGYEPAWTANAQRLAFVTRNDLWVADADGSHRSLLVRNAHDPTWAPNGRRLAFARDGWIWTVRADGLDLRRLAPGAHPAWSPDGRRIAFDRDDTIVTVRWFGGDPRQVTAGTEPAYSAAGRLAYVVDGQVVAGPRTIGTGTSPTWAPGGKQVAYESGGSIYVDGRLIGKGRHPAWRPKPRVRELLPDLHQRPPAGLVVAGSAGKLLLGFTSLVDNIGLGPTIVTGVRHAGQPRMRASQRVKLANGRSRTYKGVARLRYTNSPPHHHWHLLHFDRFELRTLDGATVVSDRKSGFCLADHWGLAPGRWPHRHPHFLGDCKQFQPDALSVTMGTSPGFTDRYPAFFHGQNVDITHVPAGLYDLVHRVNANLQLHELRYENNAASARIRLSWVDGQPTVKLLRSCPATTVC